MEKAKRFYLKPQIEVMDIQTEGVIAGSGDIEVPPETLEAILSPSCTNSSINQIPPNQCFQFTINQRNGGCKAWDFFDLHGIKTGNLVEICNKGEYYTIKKL